MNALAFVVIAYIILSAHRGFRKGLILSAFSIISLFVTLIFSACFTPVMRNAIDKQFHETLAEKIPALFLGQLLNTISFALCVVLITLIIFVIRKEVQELVKDSVLHVPDMVAGMALGVIKSLFVIWIAFVIIELTSDLEFSQRCLVQIQENSVLQMLAENNILKQVTENIQTSLLSVTHMKLKL